MKIEFLNAKTTSEAIRKLMRDHDEFHWAVAWGTTNDLTQEMLRATNKFRNVTFGVAFSQTDPDVIDALVGVKHARVATKFHGGTYHPKVYCFRSKTKAAAVVGSANFTRGGLDKNHEAAVLIKGDPNDPFFRDLLNFAAESAGYGETITKDFAATYRLSHQRASRMPKPPRDPLANLTAPQRKALQSQILSLSWNQYVGAVYSSSALHDPAESLQLLRIAQKWFAAVPSFSDLSAAQRKAVAGVIGERQKTDKELKRDWGWFGSMKGAGDFANRIDENDQYLAKAVNSIPQKGEVLKEHYDRFLELFAKAFANSERGGQVPTASRLLAMKRPDTFLCVCSPNREEAARQLGFSKSTLKLDDYWEKVVEPIRLSEWYNEEKPAGKHGDLWESRVAMLDTIFYIG